jgi:hypothetical protein
MTARQKKITEAREKYFAITEKAYAEYQLVRREIQKMIDDFHVPAGKKYEDIQQRAWSDYCFAVDQANHIQPKTEGVYILDLPGNGRFGS